MTNELSINVFFMCMYISQVLKHILKVKCYMVLHFNKKSFDGITFKSLQIFYSLLKDVK